VPADAVSESCKEVHWLASRALTASPLLIENRIALVPQIRSNNRLDLGENPVDLELELPSFPACDALGVVRPPEAPGSRIAQRAFNGGVAELCAFTSAVPALVEEAGDHFLASVFEDRI